MTISTQKAGKIVLLWVVSLNFYSGGTLRYGTFQYGTYCVLYVIFLYG